MKLGKILVLAAAALVLGSCGQGGNSSSSSTSSTGSSGSSSTSQSAHTLQNVMKDICNTIFGSAKKGTDYFDDGDGGYYTGVDYGSSSSLKAVTEDLMSCMPSYLTFDGGPEQGTWDDDSDGWFAFYSVDDILVDIGSYFEDGSYVGQVSVYPAED